MFRVAVPVFLMVTVLAELVVVVATEPNASDVGVTVPWADPDEVVRTVSCKVTDAYDPLLTHARTMIWWVPAAMLML